MKKIAVILFGKLAERYAENFQNVKKALNEADMKILFKTYVSLMFFFTLISFFISLILSALVFSFLSINPLFSIPTAIVLSSLTFILLYIYPAQKASARKRNLEANLPFAINHMAAIASSGVPPKVIFKLLSEFKEYGEVSKEAEKIIRNVEIFGQDITTAIEYVASKTPSQQFKELLYGILSTIKTGGNLKSFLQVKAREALFLYKLRREEYLQVLSTYADFYTAVMIAAPLFLISILAVMNMIGGTIQGMTIRDLMNLCIYLVIPIVNIAFILFIEITQPEQV